MNRYPVNVMRRRRLLLTLALLLFAMAGCALGSATAAPAEIRYGEDLCADCGMIINEPRFAVSYAWEIEPNRYESVAFDDMGDLVNHLKANQERVLAGIWAHDFYSEEWIDAEAAFYVVSPDIRSPMGHGVAAFNSEAPAAELAASFGVAVLDWDHMRIEILSHDH
ncbi:MAG: nitrous oxide reductase accessory protein NosL [Caldilineaceae bacterium]